MAETTRKSHRRRLWARLFLAAPAVTVLAVPWYARLHPLVAEVPFFYAYLLAWVPGSALALLAAYLLSR